MGSLMPVIPPQALNMGEALGVQWRFLRPWCAPVRGKLHVELERVPSLPRVRFRGLQLSLFDRGSAHSADQLRDVRHALALLAMVARVDLRAWQHVLEKYCGLDEATELETDGMNETATSKFTVSIVGEEDIEDFEAACGLLLSFLAVLDTPPSSRFVKTAVKIAGMGDSRQQPLDVLLGLTIDGRADGAAPHVQNVWAKLEAVQTKHRGWRIPISVGHHSKGSGGHETLEDGTLSVPECSLVLDQIEIDIAGEIFTPERAEMAGCFVERGKGAALRLTTHAAFVDDDVEQATRILGNMYNRVLGINFPNSASRAALQSVYLHCEHASISQIQNLCYALSQTQSTDTVILRFEQEDMADLSRLKVWSLLGHSFFSKYAETNSSITNVSLHDIVLTESDIVGFAEALSTNDIVNFLPSESDHTRIIMSGYMLQKGTPVIHRPSHLEVETPPQAVRWKLENDVYGVSVVDGNANDSDAAENSNLSADKSLVVVPGYGICTVARAMLVPVDGSCQPIGRKVDTLNLHFAEGHWTPGVAAGLHTLLRIVGNPLTHLSLEFTGDTPEYLSRSLQFCPNLETLIVSGYTMSASLFVETYQEHNLHIAVIDCRFDDLGVLASALSDSGSRLAQNLKRIIFDFPTHWAPAQQQQFLAIVEMLERNRTLEYVHINVPSNVFGIVSKATDRHHNTPLPVIQAPLSLLNRLAFLSVLRKVSWMSLEQSLVQSVFDFASDYRCRHVSVGKWHTSHFNWQ